ncbi:hypothetical protein Gohar_006959 [Gossypium harknessii]|uniref:Uncharacterized protein n=1 Tax=Gossypium harknessii TaxID=34285 RepID=A0A7J9GH55_9ROSI|nr:hypothetical protein [Gossypium harknessii]
MSHYKFKDYSMVKKDIDVCIANATVVTSIFDMNTLQEDSVVWHGVENIGIIARMSNDTQAEKVITR